jgi:hypothetical protein
MLMMAQYLVDLIESKDTGTPVKIINFQGYSPLEVFSTDTSSHRCTSANIDQTTPTCKNRRITFHDYCKLTKAPPSTNI